MEIQIGFRLDDVKHLMSLAKALMLLSNKEFVRLTEISMELERLTAEEQVLKKKVEDLAHMYNLLNEIHNLDQRMQEMREEEKQLKERLNKLRTAVDTFQKLDQMI